MRWYGLAHMWLLSLRMLAEAQDVFGIDFDMAEFEQVARNGLVSDEEELDEDVSIRKSAVTITLSLSAVESAVECIQWLMAHVRLNCVDK